jgi:hypothetical protein
MSRIEMENKEESWQSRAVWKRGLAMVLFGVFAGFVRLGITIIAVVQFLSLLFTQKPNRALVMFGQYLNNYLYQINQFLTCNTESYPFPFGNWSTSTAENEL